MSENRGSALLRGRIILGVGGLYTVRSGGQEYGLIKARGIFRKRKIRPVVGDYVDFVPARGEENGWIEAIGERKNVFVRPPVANITQMFIVLTCAPQPDYLLAERLLILCEMHDIRAVVLVNKADMDEGFAASLRDSYEKAGLAALMVSAATGEGIEDLRQRLTAHTSAFAGQSGVGKSSLISRLFPERALEVGNISRRISRGRHTTRHVEMIYISEETRVFDTPGFSLLELPLMDAATLKDYYPQFYPYEGSCRFDGCTHRNEPGCAVRAAAENGEISRMRLELYQRMFAETKEKWDGKYD